MSHVAIIDAGKFSVYHQGRTSPLYWGIWGLMLVESIVFASLLSSYLYLRLVAPEWPPAGVKPPDLLLPTINTVLLLASSYFVHLADSGIRKGNQRALTLGLLAGIVLAFTFLVIKYIEYSELSYRWDSHAYGSIVWTITGFHTAHVIALILKTVVVETLAIRGYFNAERNIAVQVNGLYWNFVVIVWLPLYAMLYFAPRLLD